MIKLTDEQLQIDLYNLQIMQSLSQKQDYLSKQILDNGYDPEQFQDYMLHHSNKELDLNLWNMAELKSVVAKFRKFKSKNGKNQSEDEEDDNKKEKEIQMKNSEKNNEITQPKEKAQQNEKILRSESEASKKKNSASFSNSVNSSLYKPFQFKKKSQIPELYVLAHIEKKPFSIKIKNYTKTVPNNIFKSSYIQYNIECSENWRVKRRFTDFVWLQHFLKSTYEGLPIPPIPEKTTIRSFDEKHVDYRMMMFEKFLNTLVQIPQTCSDPILEIFLRGSQEYFSQSKKKFQEKLDAQFGSKKLQSIYGDELILLDQHTIEPAVTNFYKQYSLKLTNLSSQLNILIDDMKKVESDIFQVSSTFQQLQTLISTSIKGSEFAGILQQFCNNLGMHVAKTTEYIKSNLYSPWNYETMYAQNLLANLTKIQKQRNHMNQKYKNAMIKVPDEGSQAFTNSMEPNKIIKQFQMVKQLYRVKLSYNVREMKRYQQGGMRIIAKQWGSELRGFISQISELMIGCTDSLTKNMCIIEGKKLMEVEYIKK